jgi:hypothetical protein
VLRRSFFDNKEVVVMLMDKQSREVPGFKQTNEIPGMEEPRQLRQPFSLVIEKLLTAGAA